MSFSSNIGKWSKDATQEIAEANKSIIFELFSSVIEDTPVADTIDGPGDSGKIVGGRLRGNWIVSAGTQSTETIDNVDDGSDPGGKKTIDNVQDFLRRITGSQDFSVFLTNNLPYAHRVEYDGWSHTKAPAGMVRKNFIRISNNLAGSR